MSDLIKYRLKVSTIDKRNFVGTLLAFDKHLNLVLSDTEESRIINKSYQELKKASKDTTVKVVEDRRALGLIILRGEQIVSLSIESPPITDLRKRITLEKGKGISRPLKTPTSVEGKINKLQGPAKVKNGPGFKRQN